MDGSESIEGSLANPGPCYTSEDIAASKPPGLSHGRSAKTWPRLLLSDGAHDVAPGRLEMVRSWWLQKPRSSPADDFSRKGFVAREAFTQIAVE